MKTKLRGIFLTSENPVLTAEFYKRVAGLELEQIGAQGAFTYWKIDTGEMQLAIHNAKDFADYTSPACLESNVTHLYFQIANQAEFLRYLQSLEIDPYSTDDIVVTVLDPDGRKVMFGTA